ncbi:MAG: hypothetical protein ACJAR1_002757 [Rubritalea sp.]|jgi:hypothetical protein
MRKQTKLNITLAAAGFALVASTANAATVLVAEDWQGNNIANGTRLDDTTTNYTGWQFTQGNGNVFVSRDAVTDVPGGTEGAANQSLQFEWTGSNAEYDTGHTWAADDEFSLSFNATELNWGNLTDRTVVIEITETFRNVSGDLTGTQLWTQSFALPEYDALHNSSSEDWSAAQTFSASFTGANFSGGTAGSSLTLEVGSADGRGLYVDNINLSLVPEPSTTALIGLGGLALILRRRK